MAADAASTLPVIDELIAPVSWQTIDFISDLHLAEDTPLATDAWAAYLRHTGADAIFILGDLFEAWVGDDARHDGFEARCAEELRAAAAGRCVAFMAGNRDFLVGDALLRACGVRALADPTVLSAFGQRVLLSHGDALCLADTAYQRFRGQVREPAWQAQVLSRPLAERRAAARRMRGESARHKASQAADTWFDIDRPTALRWMTEAATPTLIHGHTHHPGSELLAPGFTREVLSDWELDAGPKPRAEVLRWRAGTGLVRLAPAAAG